MENEEYVMIPRKELQRWLEIGDAASILMEEATSTISAANLKVLGIQGWLNYYLRPRAESDG